MDAFELMTTRRSTRRFRSEAVPEEKLQQILEAGRHAPSGGNNQSTHLLEIRNPEILRELAKKAEQEFAKMDVQPETYKSLAGSIRASKKGGYVFHYHAPVLILTANQKSYSNNIADCACVLENMMLMANALDLGSVWINQMKWLNDSDLINEVLFRIGMKDSERVYGGLAVGIPDTEDGLPVRTALERTGNPVTWID